MFKINDNYLKLPGSYLFSEIAKRVRDFQAAHPDADVIRMGIGDVTRPLCPAAIAGLQRGVMDQAKAETFHGYGPEQGYEFLAEKIAQHDYRERGIEMAVDEIFVSDGAKSDLGNIADILAPDSRLALTDPAYPVLIDTTVMSGRGGHLLPDGRWSNIEYLPCTADNGFVPPLPATRPDLVYLCFPNNPTGTVLTRGELQRWVDYCVREGVLILFDSAYEAYITDPEIPRSIYEMEGARQVAIEIRSFSKTAGFTGVRLGYTVIPHELRGLGPDGKRVELNPLWRRRQTTKFNGASYISQRGAEALFTPEGQAQVRESVDYYMRNSAELLRGVRQAGLEAVGGENSPYVWIKTPGQSSWDFFDLLLHRCHIVGTPGVGFGPCGEGYFRLTGFGDIEATREASRRLSRL